MNFNKLLFLTILIPNLFVHSYGMESSTEDLALFCAATYGSSVARAYCDKYALKLLTNTESDVRFKLSAVCVPRRPIPQDTVQAVLFHTLRPLAGAAAGAAFYMLPSLIDTVSENMISPMTKEMLKQTGKIIIAGNLLQYLPIRLGSFKTDGYEANECIRARDNRLLIQAQNSRHATQSQQE